MNYQRVKMQAFIQRKLKEKSLELRSLKGSERQRAEQLLIAKAKEEFMGHKNAKQRENKVEAKVTDTEGDESNTGNNESGSSTEQGETNDSGSESDSNESTDSTDESNDESTTETEKKLEEMNEEELRAHAKENKIELGNSTSVNGILKKILASK